MLCVFHASAMVSPMGTPQLSNRPALGEDARLTMATAMLKSPDCICVFGSEHSNLNCQK